MSDLNPQLKKQLDKLAQLCCRSLEGGRAVDENELQDLMKAMLMSGYARDPKASLQADLESRVKEMCPEPSMHRGGSLSAITKQLGEKFDDLVQRESRQPTARSTPTAANLSSASEA